MSFLFPSHYYLLQCKYNDENDGGNTRGAKGLSRDSSNTVSVTGGCAGSLSGVDSNPVMKKMKGSKEDKGGGEKKKERRKDSEGKRREDICVEEEKQDSLGGEESLGGDLAVLPVLRATTPKSNRMTALPNLAIDNTVGEFKEDVEEVAFHRRKLDSVIPTISYR
jgi:hypothetical protein